MKVVTVKMPESYVEAIDKLVALGRYSSRSEVIRAAVRQLLDKELGSLGLVPPKSWKRISKVISVES